MKLAARESACRRARPRACGSESDLARLKQLVLGTRGSEIAEAALVLPLVFMLLLGIYWFGRAFNTYATINHAARQGARYAVAQSCASCPNGSGNVPPTVAAIADQVKQALQASSLDPTKVVTPSSIPAACGGGNASCSASTIDPKIQYCTNVLVDNYNASGSPPASSGPAACGVAVSFQYPYQFYFPFTSLNMQLVTLSADVQMKGEY